MEACALRTEILGVGFDDLTIEEAADRASALLEEEGFHYVVTPNPELVDRARREETFREALNGADLVLPDGIGVVYAARLLGRTDIGCLAPGMAADCFLIDLDRLSLVGAQFDPMSVLGTVGFKGNVDYTIVNGVPVVQNGELTTIDEAETVREADRVVRRYLGR